ncbi:unnamed protein product [Tilletia controversa]|nr:unnamed protein product [Tilletia controversa]CAD6963042.1 unnamed protein product [Tilletia controversa]CAD6963599.1 unnamed protein product [Tilletia controversa]CAD6984913.1 unnamed protein product [Tilletia controversa]
MTALLPILVKFCFPAVEDREQLTISALLIPVILQLFSVHLLLRYPRSQLALRLRQVVLLPLIVVFGIRSAYAFTVKDVPCAPGESGTPRFGGQQLFRIFFPMYWCCYSTIKAYEWAFYPRPMLQKPLLDLASRLERQRANDSTSGKQEVPNGDTTVDDGQGSNGLPKYFPGTKIPLEIHLLTTLCGGGWDWGPRYSVDVPPPTPFDLVASDPKAIQEWRKDRIRFLKARFQRFVTSLALMDIIDSVSKSEVLWGVFAGQGAPIIDGVVQHEGVDLSTFSWPARVSLSLATGSFIVLSMALQHSFFSFLSVLPSALWPRSKVVADYLWSDPSHWSPPMADLRFWTVPSMRAFWSTHWHQILRRCLLVGGYYPTKAVLSVLFSLGRTSGAPTQAVVASMRDTGPVVSGRVVPQRKKSMGFEKMVEHALCSLATFALSGLIHELILLAVATNAEERSPLRIVGLGQPVVFADGSEDRGGKLLLFFTLQGVACIAEEVVEAISGRKVGGRLGTIWVFSFIVLTCPLFTKIWWHFGMLNGTRIDPYTSALVDWTARHIMRA